MVQSFIFGFLQWFGLVAFVSVLGIFLLRDRLSREMVFYLFGKRWVLRVEPTPETKGRM